MERRTKIAIAGTTAAIIIIVIALATIIIDKLTPSKEVMPLTDYYKLQDSEVMVILQDEIYEKKGMLVDGRVYIDYDTVVDQFNHRFYWDYNENILSYTTPDEIIRVEAGNNEYTMTKSMIETNVATDYPVVKVFGDQVYLALDFVKEYSDLKFEFFKDPDRVIITYIWGDFLYTEVSKATQLRYEPSIKSPILVQLPVGTSLKYVDTEEAPKKGFVKVMTADGIRGYVQSKKVKKSSYQKLESSFKEPVYTAQARQGKINMAFHQFFNTDAADNLESFIDETKGVTVVSPTWFSVNDESGTFTSVATADYVEKAKDLGLEVWAAVDDFNSQPKVNMMNLLSYTSRRDALSNALIEAAIEYKINGINIDFENISKDTGIHYIQFLRELSVKCRNNGIVLSVDSFPPTAYTEHYDREEQGKIVDYIVVMAYNEYYAGMEVAGPVASIGFVNDAVNNILEVVPKEKTIIAIPFYSRLWKESAEGELTSENLTMTQAENVINENGAKPKWDTATGYNYVEYKKDGATYSMWQEDKKSLEEKMKVIYDADVAGIAEWKLGLENETAWDAILPYLE
jgi:spore germination protein YaaH